VAGLYISMATFDYCGIFVEHPLIDDLKKEEVDAGFAFEVVK
jgi:hypothetical protein